MNKKKSACVGLIASLTVCTTQFAQDETADSAVAAREILARFGSEVPDWKLRMRSLIEVVKKGPGTVPVFVESLESEAPTRRRVFAAQALAVMADPRSRGALLAALDDPVAQIRSYALHGLGTLGRVELEKDRVSTILNEDPSRRVRVDGIHGLLPNVELWPKPFEAWTDRDWETRTLSVFVDFKKREVLFASGAHPKNRMRRRGRLWHSYLSGLGRLATPLAPSTESE